MNSSLDNIYAQASDHITDFQFDSKVAGVFGDMIRRSVPGYAQIIATLGNLADGYVTSNTKIYDLGCSLGAASLSIRRKIDGRNAEIIAVDFSESMVVRCRENLQAYVSETKVNVIQADIRDIDIVNASMVVLNFTLQFLPIEERDRIINKIYQGMNPGGILVISEKLIFDDETIQELLDNQHLDFKRDNGYSELEISQKRSALENVMKPDTLATHKQRLQDVGFNHFSVWFQCFNFASMVAIK